MLSVWQSPRNWFAAALPPRQRYDEFQLDFKKSSVEHIGDFVIPQPLSSVFIIVTRN